jgi:hypothetical protein
MAEHFLWLPEIKQVHLAAEMSRKKTLYRVIERRRDAALIDETRHLLAQSRERLQ